MMRCSPWSYILFAIRCLLLPTTSNACFLWVMILLISQKGKSEKGRWNIVSFAEICKSSFKGSYFVE